MSAPSLREFILRSIDRPQAPRLRISQAGRACEREVYYSATGAEAEPDKPESRVKMAIGSAFDAYALANPSAPAALRDWVFQVPVEIKIGGLTLHGTADAVYFGGPWLSEELSAREYQNAQHVADLKTVGSKTWKKVQNDAKSEHRAQTNLYAFGLNAATFSVCYVNADTGEILEHVYPMSEADARRDFGMFEEVAYWINRGEAPPRPYSDIEEDDGTVKVAKEQFPCAWCRFKTTCWADECDEEAA